jgi:hypothetical protein
MDTNFTITGERSVCQIRLGFSHARPSTCSSLSLKLQSRFRYSLSSLNLCLNMWGEIKFGTFHSSATVYFVWRWNTVCHFTIVWPCIVTDSLWIKPTDALSSNFVGITTLYVSGSLSTHHQEFLAIHRPSYILCGCDEPFATRSRMELPAAVHLLVLFTIYHVSQQQVTPKHLYVCTTEQAVTAQKTVVVRISITWNLNRSKPSGYFVHH